MIRCIIVDDELPAIRYLQTLIQGIPEVEIVKSFNNAEKCLAEIEQLNFNTCLLDIHMPGMNGLELARHLPGKAIIFSTAFKEFAADAFDLNAVDYLRKPYQLTRLATAFEKAKLWLGKQPNIANQEIELNTAVGKSRINPANILFIEVADHDRRDKNIYVNTDQIILAKNVSLDELLSILPKAEFAQINRKTIIALSQVESYTSQSVTCKSPQGKKGTQLSLSGAYKTSFLSQLTTRYSF